MRVAVVLGWAALLLVACDVTPPAAFHCSTTEDCAPGDVCRQGTCQAPLATVPGADSRAAVGASSGVNQASGGSSQGAASAATSSRSAESGPASTISRASSSVSATSDAPATSNVTAASSASSSSLSGVDSTSGVVASSAGPRASSAAGTSSAAASSAGTAASSGMATTSSSAAASSTSTMPACMGPAVECGGQCVDTMADNLHCGGCNAPCTARDARTPTTCGNGTCVPDCVDGDVACDGLCKDTRNDLAHCGGCNTPCSTSVPSATATCVEGTCAVTCPAGLTLCGNACVDITSNADHCGACNNPCPGVANGTATCSSRTCGFSCNAGFAPLAGRCATWGGAYQLDEDTCRGGAPTACRTPNPYTGACSCPAGFASAGAHRVLDDTGCPGVVGAPYGWTNMHTCISAGAASATAAEFRGVYYINADNGCVPNPTTGACTCPAGSSALALTHSGSCWKRQNIFMCMHDTYVTSTFAGGYVQSDVAGTGYGCVRANPSTGNCSCPAGSVASAYRSIFGPPTQCSSNGQYGALIYMCRQP